MGMDTLRAIDGIEIFPVISLVLFVIVFTAMLVRAARLDRRQLDQCARIPLIDEPATASAIPDPLTAKELRRVRKV